MGTIHRLTPPSTSCRCGGDMPGTCPGWRSCPCWDSSWLQEEAQNALMERHLTDAAWLEKHLNDFNAEACKAFAEAYAAIKVPKTQAELALCAIANSLWDGLQWAVQDMDDDYTGDVA